MDIAKVRISRRPLTAKQRLTAIRRELLAIKRDFNLAARAPTCGDCGRVEQAIIEIDNIRENWWSGTRPKKKNKRRGS